MIPLRRVDGRPEVGKVQAAIEVLAVRKCGVLVEYRNEGNVVSGVGVATLFLPKVVRPPNEDVAGVGNSGYRGSRFSVRYYLDCFPLYAPMGRSDI